MHCLSELEDSNNCTLPSISDCNNSSTIHDNDVINNNKENCYTEESECLKEKSKEISQKKSR